MQVNLPFTRLFLSPSNTFHSYGPKRTYTAREERAVLKLAQVEGNEEGSGHEHQGQQGRIGLVQFSHG